MEEYLPFVSIDTWTIIMSWGNLLILFLLLKHFLFKPINKVLDARAKEIDDTYKAAEDVKASAEGMRGEYEKKLEGAQTEADGIIKSAVETANMRAKSVIDEASEKARGIMEKSQQQAERDREKAVAMAREDIAVIAVDAAEKLIKKKLGTKDDEELIADIIDRI